MSNSSDARKAGLVAIKYATRFYVETVKQGKPLEPTDANLMEVLKNCARRPRREWFEAIRQMLAEKYEIRLAR